MNDPHGRSRAGAAPRPYNVLGNGWPADGRLPGRSIAESLRTANRPPEGKWLQRVTSIIDRGVEHDAKVVVVPMVGLRPVRRGPGAAESDARRGAKEGRRAETRGIELQSRGGHGELRDHPREDGQGEARGDEAATRPARRALRPERPTRQG